MKELSFNEVTSLLAYDAKKLKLVCGWRKATIEIYSDYIDVEYRTTDSVHRIPENSANEWRMYAIHDELVFVLTYYYVSMGVWFFFVCLFV